jgi:hypothetical protein
MKIINVFLILSLCFFNARSWSQEDTSGDSDSSSGSEISPDTGSADEGSEVPEKIPEPEKKPETEKTPDTGKKPDNTAKTPQQEAEDSAAREVGRVIGNKIGQDAVKKMNQVDRKALLERTRTAIRGELLRKYSFSESPYMNSFIGSVTVLRVGKDHVGLKCKELEIDLVYKVERIYARPTLCQEANGEWLETDVRNVIFARRGESKPGAESGNSPHEPESGGWLPPL